MSVDVDYTSHDDPPVLLGPDRRVPEPFTTGLKYTGLVLGFTILLFFYLIFTGIHQYQPEEQHDNQQLNSTDRSMPDQAGGVREPQL